MISVPKPHTHPNLFLRLGALPQLITCAGLTPRCGTLSSKRQGTVLPTQMRADIPDVNVLFQRAVPQGKRCGRIARLK